VRGRKAVRINPRAEKSIALWKGAADKRVRRELGVSNDEMACMRAVMRDTDGNGGPWFYQYAIRKGLIDHELV
jgi:hypothetical protein